MKRVLRKLPGLFIIAVVVAALASSPAFAADCEAPYTLDDMLTDLAMTEASLRGGDNAGANESASRLNAGLECTDDVVPAPMVPRIYRALGLSGYARLDFRLPEDDRAVFLEANPNPDISSDEEFAAAAEAAGLPYPRLIQRIVSLGVRASQGR